MAMMIMMILQCNSSFVYLNLMAFDCFGNQSCSLFNFRSFLFHLGPITHSLSLSLSFLLLSNSFCCVAVRCCGCHPLLLYLFALQNIGMLIEIHRLFFCLSHFASIFAFVVVLKVGFEFVNCCLFERLLKFMREVRNTFNWMNMLKLESHTQTNECMVIDLSLSRINTRRNERTNEHANEWMNCRMEKSVTITEIRQFFFKLKAINYLSLRIYGWYAKLKINRRNETVIQKRSNTFYWAYIDMGAHCAQSSIVYSSSEKERKTITNTKNQWRQLNHFYRFKYTHK